MLWKKIREYIESNGLKHGVIAKKSNLSLQSFSAMLNGKRKITADEYFMICQALGVPVNYFFDELQNKPAEAV